MADETCEEIEDRIAAEVAKLFEARGYPHRTVVRNFSLHGFSLDLAVLDPVTGEVVAIVEVKRKRGHTSISALPQAKFLRRAVVGRDVTVLVALVSEEGEPEFWELTDDDELKRLEQPFRQVELPDYETLRLKHKAESIEAVKAKRKRSLDRLTGVCYSLAVVTLLLLLLSLTQVILLEGEDIALLGIVCFLALVPDASRLKILGMEFERLREPLERSDWTETEATGKTDSSAE